MKPFTSAAISNAAMWLAVGAAICVTIIITHRIIPLWFFVIPALGGYTAKTDNAKEGKNDD